MRDHKDYDPDVYKRLDLVQKQFRRKAAEEKRQKSAELRQQLTSNLARNKIRIGRLVTYLVLAVLVLAIIGIAVTEMISR